MMLEKIIGGIISGLVVAGVLSGIRFIVKKNWKFPLWSIIISVIGGVAIGGLVIPYFVITGPSCKSIVSSPPPIKLHVFNGDRTTAEKRARQTGILITDNPRNVLGTEENLPAFIAELPSIGIPTEGIIRVSGTYEIHADDLGGGLPSAFVTTTQRDVVVNRVPIEIDKKLKVPIEFVTKIDYRLGQIDKVELRVFYAGSWGFFLNLIKFEVCEKK